jgi:hypothetical protein
MLRTPIPTPGSTAGAKAKRLSYIGGNTLTENRHGRTVEAGLGSTTGLSRARQPRRWRCAIRRDRNDSRWAPTRLMVRASRRRPAHLNVTPHIAQNAPTAVRQLMPAPRATPATRSASRSISERGGPFGWAKTIGGLARPMQQGAARLRFKFTLTMATSELIRPPKLLRALA